VKLDIEKLRFDLRVWDLEKDPPFKKPQNLIIVFVLILDLSKILEKW